jgi:hypothetical protein
MDERQDDENLVEYMLCQQLDLRLRNYQGECK